MNLYQVVKSLQTIALANPYIRNVGDGSIYDFMDANPSIKYGVFFVSQTNHREDEYFDWYGFNLFVIDRLVDNLESNRLQIQSIAKDVLSNTIQTFITKFIGITHTEIRYTPFTQKFSDLCAGEYCSIEFRIPKAIVCEEDYKIFVPVSPDCPECEDCNKCYNNGYESGYTDGVNSVECPDYTDYWNSGYTSGFTDGVESVDCTPLYNSGYTAGIDYQKSLLTSTAITHNGEYVNENGFSAVTVIVPQTGQSINNQTVQAEYTVNGNYEVTYATGYTGLEKVNVKVSVPQTGHTDQEMDDMYQSGYTDGVNSVDCTPLYESGYTGGYQSGYTDGVNSVVCEDCSTYFDSGYTSGVTDGYESGFTDGVNSVDCTPLYNSGYTGGYESGFTDGVNSVDCTPLYESGLTEGYNSGYTAGYESGSTDGYQSGITYQKSLLANTAFTENGTYTREDGWSAVTVEIDTQSYYDKGYEDAMKENGNYIKLPLTFDIISGGNITYTVDADNQAKTIQYSKNYGEWTSITSSKNGTNIPVEAGDTLRFRGNVDTVSDNYGCGRLTGTKCNIYGNVMSLLNSTNFSGMTSTLGVGTFQHLFKQLGVVDASNLILPATTLTNSCYYHMFISCTSLIAPPQLPATNLAEYCYQGMFELCSNLPTAPELNATTLVEGCYMYMFKLCTSLNYIKCMATNIYQSIIPTDALFSWVGGLSEVNGTFVKSSSTNWVGERTDPGPGWGQDGVPLNELQKWTIVNA